MNAENTLPTFVETEPLPAATEETFVSVSESTAPSDETASQTVAVVPAQEQNGDTLAAVVSGFQTMHDDIVTLQTETCNALFGASLILCGVLCAVVIFRGLFNYD